MQNDKLVLSLVSCHSNEAFIFLLGYVLKASILILIQSEMEGRFGKLKCCIM